MINNAAQLSPSVRKLSIMSASTISNQTLSAMNNTNVNAIPEFTDDDDRSIQHKNLRKRYLPLITYIDSLIKPNSNICFKVKLLLRSFDNELYVVGEISDSNNSFDCCCGGEAQLGECICSIKDLSFDQSLCLEELRIHNYKDLLIASIDYPPDNTNTGEVSGKTPDNAKIVDVSNSIETDLFPESITNNKMTTEFSLPNQHKLISDNKATKKITSSQESNSQEQLISLNESIPLQRNESVSQSRLTDDLRISNKSKFVNQLKLIDHNNLAEVIPQKLSDDFRSYDEKSKNISHLMIDYSPLSNYLPSNAYDSHNETFAASYYVTQSERNDNSSTKKKLPKLVRSDYALYASNNDSLEKKLEEESVLNQKCNNATKNDCITSYVFEDCGDKNIKMPVKTTETYLESFSTKQTDEPESWKVANNLTTNCIYEQKPTNASGVNKWHSDTNTSSKEYNIQLFPEIRNEEAHVKEQKEILLNALGLTKTKNTTKTSPKSTTKKSETPSNNIIAIKSSNKGDNCVHTEVIRIQKISEN